MLVSIGIAAVLVTGAVMQVSPPSNGEELADQIAMPDSYSGDAYFYMESKQSSPWKRVDFKVSLDSILMINYWISEGLGESISEVVFGSAKESLMFRPAQRTVEKNTRFADTSTHAGEVDITPMPIVRALQDRSEYLKIEGVERANNGMVTYRVSDPVLQSVGPVEIDLLENKIIEYRMSKREGRFMAIVRYEEWHEFREDKWVPTKITSKTWDARSGDYYTMYIGIENLKPLRGGSDIKPPSIPEGHTVIDHIRGVTEQNGEVLGEINYGEADSPQVQKGKALNQWLLWGGVGLVVFSGLLIGLKKRPA